MKIIVVDDLEIIDVDDQYLLKSDKSDSFCVVNRSGYELISMLRGGGALNTSEFTDTSELVITFLREMEDAGLITTEEE